MANKVKPCSSDAPDNWSSEEDGPRNVGALCVYLDKIINLMRYFGVYTHTSQTRKAKIIQIVYAASIFIYEFYAALAQASKLSQEQTFGSGLFYKIVVFIFRLYIAIQLLIPSLVLGKFVLLRESWNRLEYRRTAEFPVMIKKNLRRIWLASCLSCMFLFIFEGSTSIPFWLLGADAFLNYTVPLSSSTWTVRAKICIYLASAILDLLTAISCFLFTFLYTCVWYIIRSELKQLNEEIAKYASKKVQQYNACEEVGGNVPGSEIHINDGNILEEFRLRHDNICQMIDSENKLFKYQRAVLFSVTLVVICITLYNIVHYDTLNDVYMVLILLIQAAFANCALLITLFSSIDVNEKVIYVCICESAYVGVSVFVGESVPRMCG